MNQTEIDELRRLYVRLVDADNFEIATTYGGSAVTFSTEAGGATRNALPRLLAALGEAWGRLGVAEAELDSARSVIEAYASNSVAGVAVKKALEVDADRDAAESLAWDALGRPDGTHDMSNVQRLCEAHIALKAKLASKGACDIAAERSRQMEKWGNDHDDEHSGGALAYRAAELAAAHTHLRVFASPPDLWGLLEKHRETRQRLVIAGALVAAEIDRLDRAALAAAKVQP